MRQLFTTPETNLDLGHHASLPAVPQAANALTDVMIAFFRNLKKIAAAVLVFLFLIGTYFFLRPKSYESRMLFLVRDEGAAIAPTPLDPRNQPAPATTDLQIGTEMELLSGAQLQRQVIAQLHPNLSEAEMNHRLLAFNQALSVLPVPKTTLISVVYRANRQDEADRTLGVLSRLYLAYRAKIRNSDGTYAFFNQQANHYHEKLQEDQATLAAFEQKYHVTSIGDEKNDLAHKMSDAQEKLYETSASGREAEKQIQTMLSAQASLPPRVTTQKRELPEQLVTERLNSNLVELQNKRLELLTKYYPNDRHVQELDEQIANTRAALEQAKQSSSTEEQTDLNPLKQSVDGDLQRARFLAAGLQGRQRGLTHEVSDYQAKLGELNQLTAQYDDLARKVKEDESAYDLYFKQREDARINRNLESDKIANVRQIEGPAAVPQSRAQSIVSMLAVAAIGTVLIVGVGTLLGLWSPCFYTPRELENAMGMPVLVTVPVSPETQGGGLRESLDVLTRATGRKSKYVQSSRVRVLSPGSFARDPGELGQASGIYLPLLQKLRKIDAKEFGGGSIFVFTSCTQGEGVSHVVRGLSAELVSYSGKRVAVVDAPEFFGTAAEAGGRTDALIWGKAASSEEKFVQQWFKSLRDTHDFVLVDCPSLDKSRAATLLGVQSDGLLVVVGSGKATRTQVRGGLAMLRLASVRVVGFALNKRTYPIPGPVYNFL